MTRFSSLISAALAATSVVAVASAANAAVTVRPTITVPVVRPSVPVVHPVVPVLHPVVPAVHPVIAAPKPVTPSVHATIAATHAPVLPATHASTVLPSKQATVTAPDPNSVPWANVGGTTTLPSNMVALPPTTRPAIAAVLNGKPVIKLTAVNGNETTVYYLSRDAQHIVAVISSISDIPPQNVATTQPVANHPATQSQQNHPATQLQQSHPQQPAASKPPASSGTTGGYKPVSYPEIKGADGGPMGYQGPQGAVYFTNETLPPGFTIGPNNTIETTVKQ